MLNIPIEEMNVIVTDRLTSPLNIAVYKILEYSNADDKQFLPRSYRLLLQVSNQSEAVPVSHTLLLIEDIRGDRRTLASR